MFAIDYCIVQVIFNTVLFALKGHGRRAQDTALGPGTRPEPRPERAEYQGDDAPITLFQGFMDFLSFIPQGVALGSNSSPLRGKKYS